ncbi:MAG: hypothetical protein M1826_003974 [Phylliscum demangeonii]|nr:MAG: hypothetical protein M1826_003974 [Phylliscum demangeonii]
MSAVVNQSASLHPEPKAAKKKRAKSDNVDKSSAVRVSSPKANGEGSQPSASVDGHNGTTSRDEESPYLREIHKTIRSVTKKLNAMAKVDAILAENPGVSLNDLVTSRKINADQKAQATKKPALLANLAQLEEQEAQYRKVEQEFQARMKAEKETLVAAHEAELAQVRGQAREEAKAEAQREARENVRLLSKFLRLAAAKRQDLDTDPDSDERKALEGLLLTVYGGDEGAVDAAEKLAQGVEEPVLSTMQEPVAFTYAQVKELTARYVPFFPPPVDAQEDAQQAYPSPPAGDEPQPVVSTDPTIANAGLTEISEPSLVQTDATDESPTTIPQASTEPDAANEAAESHWDVKMSASGEGNEEWVKITRDPAETETGVTATPAALTAIQSWADDHPEALPAPGPAPGEAAPPPAGNHANGLPHGSGNDGFHEVHHARGGRGRNGPHSEHRGSFRGRGAYRGSGGDGGNGGYRGRGGYRGDHRGDYRGGDGGYRGRGRGGRGGGGGGSVDGFRGGRGGAGGGGGNGREHGDQARPAGDPMPQW